MYAATDVVGLDIETDNSEGHGLDPQRGRCTLIAVACDESVNGGGEVFEGDERRMIEDLSRFLRALTPGLVSTWNGSFFDLPYLTDRARIVDADSTLRLASLPGLIPKYAPLPGHNGGYTGVWASSEAEVPHVHLDVSQAYRRFADEAGVAWSLKPVMVARGIVPVELDRTRLHDYTSAEQNAYVRSDAVGARLLALDLLGLDYAPYAA